LQGAENLLNKDVSGGLGNLAKRTLGNDRGEIGAYHGSPHSFEQFDASKIGSGEGNQAFGYGMYFTNQKEIAKSYAKKLGAKPLYKIYDATGSLLEPYLGTPYSQESKWLGEIIYKSRSTDEVLKKTEKELSPAIADIVRNEKDKISNIINDNRKNINLYNVTLNKNKKPNEYDYLKWDEPVSKSQYDKFKMEYSPDVTGESFYEMLSNFLGSDKLASEALLKAGIDGIDYPAGTLSGVKSSARNYVVFDPNVVTIEKHESGNTGAKMLAGTAAGGLGALTGYGIYKGYQNRGK
jgi:hypothetical protein